ncbi:AI-2E family transporter [Marinobacter sp.]|uniref:AI-2E family transporter n=1 Tax=Marinobacter sp. TaxID=50741 RepID=UPI003567002F
MSQGTRLFNAVELRLFRYTAVLFSLVVLAALVGIIIWAFGWLLETFYTLLLSLAVAGILALVLHPVVEFMVRRLRLPLLLAIILVLLAFFVGIGTLMFVLVPILVRQAVQLMTVLPDLLASWQTHFSVHFPALSSMVFSGTENSGGEESKQMMPGLEYTSNTIMSYLGLLVVLPMAYLQPEGGINLLILAGLVFGAVQLIESWLLTPKIMANRSGLHPALVVISLFFWGTALGGIIGMILAVPLTAFFVATWSEIKNSLKHTLSLPDARP